MVENTQLFDNVPVGLIDKLKQQINLAGELKSICFREAGTPDSYKFPLDKDLSIVDIAVIYFIDNDMQWSFEAYLDTWFQKQVDNYNVAELCWSIPNEQCN